jgi:hypothetical protein
MMQRGNSLLKPLLVLGSLALLAAGFAWLVSKPRPSQRPLQETNSARTTTPVDQPSTEDAELRPQTAEERAKFLQAPVVTQPISRPALPAAAQAPAVPRPEASAYTRQLVAALTNIDFSRGPITKEQAEQWKQGLQALTAQGAAGVPAIREFLEQNQELNFAAISGGDQLGQSSLRSALINALAQIGGPEATGVMLQTLQSTTLPSEIAQLAQFLEQQAPGQYRQETMSAIQEILGMANRGGLEGYDVGPLFKVLQSYGDPSSASTLEQLAPEWRYYATISLAGLQGAGVPSLIHEVQVPDPAAGGKREFAYQMLAQAAGQSPEASAALLEQARANQIPDSAWRKIATGLAGDQYQIGPPPGNAATLPGLKTYHIQNGNQNFYSLPVAGEGQMEQRLALINQFLGATSNPAAVAALQWAQETLAGKK